MLELVPSMTHLMSVGAKILLTLMRYDVMTYMGLLVCNHGSPQATQAANMPCLCTHASLQYVMLSEHLYFIS